MMMTIVMRRSVESALLRLAISRLISSLPHSLHRGIWDPGLNLDLPPSLELPRCTQSSIPFTQNSLPWWTERIKPEVKVVLKLEVGFQCPPSDIWITTLPICPSCCAHQCPYFCLTPRASFSVRLSGTVWSCCRVFCSAAAGRAPPSTLLCSGRRLLHIGIGGRGRGPVAHQPPPFPSSSPFSFFSFSCSSTRSLSTPSPSAQHVAMSLTTKMFLSEKVTFSTQHGRLPVSKFNLVHKTSHYKSSKICDNIFIIKLKLVVVETCPKSSSCAPPPNIGNSAKQVCERAAQTKKLSRRSNSLRHLERTQHPDELSYQLGKKHNKA